MAVVTTCAVDVVELEWPFTINSLTHKHTAVTVYDSLQLYSTDIHSTQHNGYRWSISQHQLQQSLHYIQLCVIFYAFVSLTIFETDQSRHCGMPSFPSWHYYYICWYSHSRYCKCYHTALQMSVCILQKNVGYDLMSSKILKTVTQSGRQHYIAANLKSVINSYLNRKFSSYIPEL